MNRLLLTLSLTLACSACTTQPAVTSAAPAMTGSSTTAAGSSSPGGTPYQASAEIIAIVDRLRELEATMDPDTVAAYYPEKLVAIANGRIAQPRRESIEAELRHRQQVNEYRVIDLSAPLIGVSRDGSMAWAAVHQRKKEIDHRSGAVLRTWEYATLMVFTRKPDGGWQLASMARSDSGD